MKSAWPAFLLLLTGCHSAPVMPSGTVVIAVENSPNSLDPRIGTDAQSERIGALLFDPLVIKDEHYEMRPALAVSWTQSDALTWRFLLRAGVRFHDGRALTAADAAWTINSLLDGTIVSSKAGAFAAVAQAEAPEAGTLVIHLKRPDASLLFNLSDGLFGVVPTGSGRDFGRHPIGSGPFRFVSETTDKEIVVERNPHYWQPPPAFGRVIFNVVPDAVTVALELQKGSADIASNELPPDMVYALAQRGGLGIETAPSSRVMYLNFNTAAGPLADVRVRQALACAMDRQAIVHAIWRGEATPAWTLLPPGHWAAAPQADPYPHDIPRAKALLEAAGLHAAGDGVRLHLEMKTSQDENTRLLAQILQQQLAEAGIALTLRAAEFGTFYADVTAGRFQMYALNWVGSNEDPDIFRYAFGSDRFPPHGGNRGHYANPQVDALLAQAAATPAGPAAEATRRAFFVEVQAILAHDLPAIPLWYPNNELVHTPRLTGLRLPADGSYAFLRTARFKPGKATE